MGTAQIAEQVEVLVCVSHGAVRTVPLRQRHKARLIRGGADLGAVIATREREDIRRDWEITAGELAVGYVGQLSAEKNPVAIAHGVARLPDAKLVVCSPQASDEDHPLRREIAAVLADRVVWTSSAMQPMGDIYRGLDCLVVASHEEGMPTATLERRLAICTICANSAATTAVPSAAASSPRRPPGGRVSVRSGSGR